MRDSKSSRDVMSSGAESELSEFGGSSSLPSLSMYSFSIYNFYQHIGVNHRLQDAYLVEPVVEVS
jgi:hypothetical protein